MGWQSIFCAVYERIGLGLVFSKALKSALERGEEKERKKVIIWLTEELGYHIASNAALLLLPRYAIAMNKHISTYQSINHSFFLAQGIRSDRRNGFIAVNGGCHECSVRI